jgi:peroxiredoxin
MRTEPSFRNVVALLFMAGCASQSAGHPVPPPDSLPSLDLLTLRGQAQPLTAALAGRAALVAVWATWCKACKEELDDIGRLAARAEALEVTVLGVAVGEPRAAVAEFVARHRIRYPQLVDEECRLPAALGYDDLPATLVINRAGRITFIGGSLDERALAALVAASGRSRSTLVDAR